MNAPQGKSSQYSEITNLVEKARQEMLAREKQAEADRKAGIAPKEPSDAEAANRKTADVAGTGGRRRRRAKKTAKKTAGRRRRRRTTSRR